MSKAEYLDANRDAIVAAVFAPLTKGRKMNTTTKYGAGLMALGVALMVCGFAVEVRKRLVTDRERVEALEARVRILQAHIIDVDARGMVTESNCVLFQKEQATFDAKLVDLLKAEGK